VIPAALQGLEVELFATAARGTEVALRDELKELRFFQPKADRGGARFRGKLEHAFLACLESRIAMRILIPLTTFEAYDERSYYDGFRSIDWSSLFGADTTLAVSAVSRDSTLTHTNFLAQKAKDAIVDQLRDQRGTRPFVDRDDPDVAIFVHLKKDEAKVFLDASGRSLHERGYRQAIGKAPLKETLAAAMLRLSGWDRQCTLLDPMCGAGTLPIEADLWARDVAPGLLRKQFGIERWQVIDDSLRQKFAGYRDAATSRIRTEGPEILASDLDPLAVRAAVENAARASSSVKPIVADMGHRTFPTGGAVVTNPPYGVRLEQDQWVLPTLREQVTHARPMRVGILLPEDSDLGSIPKSATLHPLTNGDIECSFAVFDVG
jgi:putative N6-adenine-specific DNA methylase